MRHRLPLGLLITLACAAFASEGFHPLQGPYMGQEAGETPRLFLPGKISTGDDEGCSVFLPGARAFLWRAQRDRENVLLLLEDKDGRWQPPEEQRILGASRVELPPGVPPAGSMPGNGSRDIYWVKAEALGGP